MKVLFIGDIMGAPGREVLRTELPKILDREKPDIVIANGENVATGVGITPATANELFTTGVDVITLGNHMWDKKEVRGLLDDKRIVRPANYPEGTPGYEYTIAATKNGVKICVINLLGRVFMNTLLCPFRTADEILAKIKTETNIIIVDIHAEATSEKTALGWYLDGRVSGVVGTHTHVATADEKILDNGTAYISDVGLTGPLRSVIGVEKDIIIKKFLTQTPQKYHVAKEKLVVEAVIIDIDEKTGKSNSIKRIRSGDGFSNKR